MTKDRKKGLLLASIGSVFWGSSGIAGQYLLLDQNISPEWLTFFRLLCASILLLAIAAVKNGNIFSIWKEGKDRLSLLIFGALGMMGTQYCYFVCIRYSNAPTATILEYLMPILIIFWFCIRGRRFPNIMEILCAFFAIAGTTMIATSGNLSKLSISEEALIWGLTSALACALYTIEPVKIIKKHGAPVVVGWGMMVASIVMIPMTFTSPFTGEINTAVLSAFAFVVLFGTVCSFVLYLGSMAYILPTEASIISAIEPLSSVIFSFILFHLTFDIYQLLGMALIICAVGVVAAYKK